MPAEVRKREKQFKKGGPVRDTKISATPGERIKNYWRLGKKPPRTEGRPLFPESGAHVCTIDAVLQAAPRVEVQIIALL
jgi:hypothetical protein